MLYPQPDHPAAFPVRKPAPNFEVPYQVWSKMPSHWGPPRNRVLSILFKALCIACFGRSTPQHIWNATATERSWKEEKDALVARSNNINVVAGLLLTSMAVMLSTQPPNPTIANWTLIFPYVCGLWACGLTLGAIIAGAAISLALSASQPSYIRKMCKSRIRVTGLLVALAYPFCTLGIATLMLCFGFVAAAWLPRSKIMMVGSIFGLILPILVAPILIWVVSV